VSGATAVDLEALEREALADVAAAADEGALEAARVKHLGRRSALKELLSRVGSLPPEQRREVGQGGNRVARAVEAALEARLAEVRGAAAVDLAHAEAIDLSFPGTPPRRGHRHPVHRVMREIEEIFRGLGYEVARGPEVETDYYNFEALNIPEGHAARDGFDSFFVADEETVRRAVEGLETNIVLRTHTSPMQVRVMEREAPPIRVIVPGKTYRRDSDATHTPMFHQVEGLLVDEGVTLADLKGTLEYFARAMFGDERRVRLRPTHFPFTEPSVEADVSCFQCGGKGCRLCSHEGWLELLGAGMVHPNVLRAGGIDPARYRGFAFGVGIDRITQLKYGVEDMRSLFDNDVRLIRQF
jgi:phenylalanyl-tRNA synthetase alpha chain